jgi:hypothetical protein
MGRLLTTPSNDRDPADEGTVEGTSTIATMPMARRAVVTTADFMLGSPKIWKIPGP